MKKGKKGVGSYIHIGKVGTVGTARKNVHFETVNLGQYWWVRKTRISAFAVPAKSVAKKLAGALNSTVRKILKKPTARKMKQGGGRHKGHSFEREIAKELQCIFPKARRQLEYHQDDAKGFDLQNTGHYLFQCKRYREYAPIEWIEEIQSDFKNNETPILVTQANDKRAMAVLPWDDFLQMLIELEGKYK